MGQLDDLSYHLLLLQHLLQCSSLSNLLSINTIILNYQCFQPTLTVIFDAGEFSFTYGKFFSLESACQEAIDYTVYLVKSGDAPYAAI